MAAGLAQGSGELRTSGAGAIHGHADEGVAGLALQTQQQVPQREAHYARETGEQQPKQQPAAAGRQRQPQHYAHES